MGTVRPSAESPQPCMGEKPHLRAQVLLAGGGGGGIEYLSAVISGVFILCFFPYSCEAVSRALHRRLL